jgi:CheY-like chemotaxis protein
MAAERVRTLIVDDEPLARKRLRTLLADEDAIEIIGEAGSGTAAVEAISTGRPDLVFLDIQMPGLDGFDVLRATAGVYQPFVVFVTAHDEHAIRAFEVEAVDYVLKPVVEARFRAAVRRAVTRLREGTPKAFARDSPGDVVRDQVLVRTATLLFGSFASSRVICSGCTAIDGVSPVAPVRARGPSDMPGRSANQYSDSNSILMPCSSFASAASSGSTSITTPTDIT